MGLPFLTMKSDIHPKTQDIKVKCSCGNLFTINSALGRDLHIDVCDKCHPFYTGRQKIVDTAGRVDRFKQKFEKMKKTSSEEKK